MPRAKKINLNSRMARAFTNYYERKHQRLKGVYAQDANSPSEPPVATYRELILADEPKLFWRLNESSGNALDSSGNGHDTAVIGFTGPDRAVPGPLRNEASTAYRMDGSTTKLVYKVGLTAAALNIDGAKPWTIESWVNASGVGITFVGAWEIGTKSADQYAALGHTNSATGWQINRYGPSDNFISPFGEGVWQLFHVVNDPGSDTPLKVYINGELIHDSATSINLGAVFPFAVGQLDSRYFQGDIAEVAVYDRVLTPEKILARVILAGYGGEPLPVTYQSEVLSDAPRIFWRMHLPDPTKHLTPDVSGHNLGADVHYVTRSMPGPILSDPDDTSFGWTLEGQGPGLTQQYLVGNGLEGSGFTTPATLGVAGGGSWTVEAWIYPTGTHNFLGIWQLGFKAAGQFAALCTGNQDRKLYIHTWNGTGIGSGVSIPWDAWTLVHVIYDHTTTTFSVYLNGSPTAAYTLTYAVTLPTSGGSFEVGRLDANQWLGRIDEVAVYSGALPAARRAARWASSGR